MGYGYRDLSNYYVCEPIQPDLEPAAFSEYMVETLDPDSLKNKALISESNRLFYNCGGTITSRYTDKTSGVDCVDISAFDSKFNAVLRQQGFNYKLGPLKLSENYTLKDYLNIKAELIRLISERKVNSALRVVFTHGTDNLAYFATWIKLLSVELHFYAVIIVAQRSHDRPTCELHALLPSAIRILLRMKHVTAICVTYCNEKFVLCHDAFEVRKTDTYAKNAFWSFNMKYVSRKNPYVVTQKEMFTIDTKFRNYRVPLLVENLFDRKSKARNQLILGTGIGNFRRTLDSNFTYTTRTTKGPFNPLIYDKEDLPLYEAFRNTGLKASTLRHFSFEALHTILNVVPKKRYSNEAL